MTLKTPDSFWEFSTQHYHRIEPLCLRLQDDAGFEINSLLWVMWCVHTRRDPAPALADAARLALAWSISVRGLREARRALKTPPDAFDTAATHALRTQVKACELEAERLLQQALETLTRGLPSLVPTATTAYARAQILAKAMGADAQHPDLVVLTKSLLG